jgi:hypothetical protein
MNNVHIALNTSLKEVKLKLDSQQAEVEKALEVYKTALAPNVDTAKYSYDLLLKEVWYLNKIYRRINKTINTIMKYDALKKIG